MEIPDFKRMTVEQKKIAVLAGLVSVLVLYALFSFLVRPLLDRAARSSEDLETLRHQIDKAQRMFNVEGTLRNQIEQAQEGLTRASAEYIVPAENPLSWVAEKVYGSAREVGVEIEKVAEIGLPAVPWQRSEELARAFVPYTVRIETRCGYDELLALLRSLETRNPYLCVSEVSVMGQVADVERHRISLSVQWPAWTDPAMATDVLTPVEPSHG